MADFFTKADLQAIEQAATVLSQFKNTIAHAKEHQEREEQRKAKAFEAVCEEVMTLIQSRFPHSSSTQLNKLRFSLSVAYVYGADEFGCFIDDLKQRLERKTPQYLAAFPEWIDNKYHDSKRCCINMLASFGDEQLDTNRAAKLFDKIDKAYGVIDQKGSNAFHNAAWYLSMTTNGLSEADKAALGIH